MKAVMWILLVVVLSFGAFIGYNLLYNSVLSKLKINRWIVVFLAFFVLIVPSLLSLDNILWVTIQGGVFAMLFLWFMDLSKQKREESKKIKIRPKAKPNRVKHNAKDEK